MCVPLRVGIIAISSLLGCVGCHRTPPLPGGYTVFRASSHEVGLSGGKYKSIVAGPKLIQVGSSGTLIFGEIALRPGVPPSESDTPGFFILDTTTEAIQKGLTREDWLKKLHEAGIAEEPGLQRP
jgi:hypothetical protein